MGSFYQPKSYMKGGGSYYQPKAYMKGGSTRRNNSKRTNRYNKRKTVKGGFYPTVMANLVKSGSMLMPLAMRAGYSLYNSFNKTRKNKK